MLTYSLWGHQKVPWGYEVRLDAWDAAGQHHPVCMTWYGGQPDEKAIAQEALRRVAHLEAQLLEPPREPEPTYTESEVVALLVHKGYLAAGEKLSDLKTREVASL